MAAPRSKHYPRIPSPHRFLIVIIISLTLLILSGLVIFTAQILSTRLTPSIPPVPNSETWNTYQDNLVSFQYPASWYPATTITGGTSTTHTITHPGDKHLLEYTIAQNYDNYTGTAWDSLKAYLPNTPYDSEFIDGIEIAVTYPQVDQAHLNQLVFFSPDNTSIHTLTLQSGDTPNPSPELIVTGNQLFQIIKDSLFFNPITLEGHLIRYTLPSPDDPYQYQLKLTAPYFDRLNAEGPRYVNTLLVVPASDTVKHLLNTHLNRHLLISGAIEWGLAETRHLRAHQLHQPLPQP